MSSRRRTTRPVVLAVTSDWHCGSTTALCPPRLPLDDGGEYRASRAQRWLWSSWLDYWRHVHARRQGADLYVIALGDLVDGDHHNTSQIISRNPGAQFAVAAAAMRPMLALAPDRVFVIRGTEAHTGHSASAEEGLAAGLLRDGVPVQPDPDTGTASHWHLRMDVKGTRLDVTHHGRTGMREHTRAGAASLHAHDILLSHVKAGDRYPDLCLRAHYHRFNDSHDACPVRVVTSGAFQLKTGFVHRVAADSLADIGGLIVTVTDDGYAVEKVHYHASRGTVWAASA